MRRSRKSRRTSIQAGAGPDPEKTRRVTANLAKLMVRLLRTMDIFAANSKPLRTRILADFNSIAKLKSTGNGTALLDLVVTELDAHFCDQTVLAGLGKSLAAKARSKHTIKVDGQDNCVGAQGFGVTVTVDGTTAGACLTGTPGNITGGGISGGFSY